MVNLLPRFYDVMSGSVKIDGVDVRDIELDSLRDKIAIVFQDNFLFAGTIRENILLGRENATQDEIDRAVKSACLEEFIASLEKDWIPKSANAACFCPAAKSSVLRLPVPLLKTRRLLFWMKLLCAR